MRTSPWKSQRWTAAGRGSVRLAAVWLAACAANSWGQADATELAVGRAHRGTLGTGDSHSYTVELGERHFVFGAADQLTVDVVVRVFGPSGDRIAEFDGPARGPESFQFESEGAGSYRVEVTPFENETGDYEISLRRAEPLAATPEAQVDQLMAAYDDPRTPGGVVAVVEGGETVFARAYGAADLTFGVPFAVDTRTNIGSTSKQFTAFAVLLLAERGELSIDDDVREHIPELPDLGEVVRLRHLMSHTSGYREFLNTVALSGRRLDEGDYIDRSELIAIVQRQPELQNRPGGEWNYNNTAFGLLATVVERVGGAPFPEWMRENVFVPLGMHDTFVRGDSHTLIERACRGYSPAEGGGWREAADLGASMGAGGIYTTVGDLARWVRNYRTGELGGPEIFGRMSERFVLNSGGVSGYGFGLFIDEFGGLDRIHHGGADTAHRSMLMYFPELDAAVITQSNNATFAGSIADAVARAFFEDRMAPEETDGVAAADNAQPEAEAFDPASFEPESFDAFAGRYEMEEVPGFVIEFTREADKYYLQATEQPRLDIVPTSPTSFRLTVVEASVDFHPGDDGTTNSLTLHQNGEHAAKRLPDEPFRLTEAQLAAYSGRYFSEELETFYEIASEEGGLVLKHRRFDPVKLAGGRDGKFTGGFPVARAEFETDAEGRATALIVGNGRTRGVRFERFD